MTIIDFAQFAAIAGGGAAVGIIITHMKASAHLDAMRSAMESAIGVSAKRFETIEFLKKEKASIGAALNEVVSELQGHKLRDEKRKMALAKGRETMAKKRAPAAAAPSNGPLVAANSSVPKAAPKKRKR
jgi:imidazolonepropionase-like amidohydrolase